ncbi:MAG: phosphatidylglycerophosphatase A [Candidatus Omnitrophica bacterium]|nr:phosphatidylglycerophosphatase A [Candidatus Omnitrophota bacterium]MDD5355962.1 phosphatidylglycerophosphatase A [Candidatus Omnitrophota bacterium]
MDAIKILATFFGIGYLPYFPGTWASIAAVAIYLLLRNNFIVYMALSIIVFLLGLLICKKAEDGFAEKDSHFIVIDEIAAFLLLLGLIPRGIVFLFFAFLFFRIFDIIKPYPIKKIENFPGSWGIMLDDVVAAFYTFWVVWGIKNIFY